MTWESIQTADKLRDTLDADDLSLEQDKSVPAGIGDSITLKSVSGILKVTVLEVIDPAKRKDGGIDEMFEELAHRDKDVSQIPKTPQRVIGIKLKVRNIQPEPEPGVGFGIAICRNVRLVDVQGNSYRPLLSGIVGCGILSVPEREEPPAIGCFGFKIPKSAILGRFLLSFSSID